MRIGSVAWKVLAGLLVALVALQAPGYLAMGAPTGSQQGVDARGASSSQAALIYVDRIAEFINATLRIASTYNISIPGNLSENVTMAEQLIGQAKSMVGVNDTEAVMLATRASSVFAPVAEYVASHMPVTAKKEIEDKMLQKALEVREKLILKLEEMLRHVNETAGIPVGDEMEKLREMQSLAEQVRLALQEGNTTKARHEMEMLDHALKSETPRLCHKTYAATAVNAALATSLADAVTHARMLAIAINITVDTVNETGNITPGVAERIKAIYEHSVEAEARLTRIIEYVNQTVDNETVNQTLLEALVELRNAFNASANYTWQAYQAALQGDANQTIVMLEQAFQEINSTLASVTKLVPMPTVLAEKMRHELRHANEIMRKAHERAEENEWAHISAEIDHKMNKLKQAYQMYENGRMSKSKYQMMLEKTKQWLVQLEERIRNSAPQWLLEKIQDALQWIQTHTP